jgi:hypothetical protein
VLVSEVITKRFGDLVPGDKFEIPEQIYPLIGVCVRRPEFVKTVKRKIGLFKKVEVQRLRMVAIELHAYLGAVEWNPEHDEDFEVLIHEK